MLIIDNISVSYGNVRALRQISLDVMPKQIVTVIGANGAGKSSLLNAVAGMVPIAEGSIRLNGMPVHNMAAHRLVSLGLGYVPEARELFRELSVIDNLVLGAYSNAESRGLKKLGIIKWLINNITFRERLSYVFKLFPRLDERKKQKSGSLSGGEQQMLAIARALMSSPRVLLLDEPSLGLAPNIVKEIMQLLARLRDEGLAILLVEQDAISSLKVADRAIVLERGQIIARGLARDIMNDERLRQAYLGKITL